MRTFDVTTSSVSFFSEYKRPSGYPSYQHQNGEVVGFDWISHVQGDPVFTHASVQLNGPSCNSLFLGHLFAEMVMGGDRVLLGTVGSGAMQVFPCKLAMSQWDISAGSFPTIRLDMPFSRREYSPTELLTEDISTFRIAMIVTLYGEYI